MAKDEDVPLGELKLENVRLSFPHLFKPKESVKDGPKKYRANFLIDPETKSGKRNLKNYEKVFEEIEDDVWGKNGVKFKPDRIPLSEGIDHEDKEGNVRDGYDGMMVIKATNNRRPQVIDRHKDPISEEDGVIYAGCYVNAILNLWGNKDKDKGGNGIFATLEGVQFVKDGERFAAGGLRDDAFDDLGDEEDEDDEDEAPRKKSKKSKSRDDEDEDDEDEKPRKKSKSKSRDEDEDDEEDEKPRKKSKRKRDDDDEDEDI